MSADTPLAPIIVRRMRKAARGHHGGAWKVAYADFVTAMMAFFLVMWIIGVGTRVQKAAIADYFENPSRKPGTATVAPPGLDGPGGASDSMIKLGGAMDLSHGPGEDHNNGPVGEVPKVLIDERAQEIDLARLEKLKEALIAAIENSENLARFKDQLLIDITPDGLRIQIVDKLDRPMFGTGSAYLKGYTEVILHKVAQFINRVPNHIRIIGHTDDAPYLSDRGYSNWELSTDRANAARRALLAGGLNEGKVARIVGVANSVPLDKEHSDNPMNRRISIIVMSKQAEETALSSGIAKSASNESEATEVKPTAAPQSAAVSSG